MGFFKKFKKENKPEDDIEDFDSVKAEGKIENEMVKDEQTIKSGNELNNLEEEIKEKNERLSTIIEKIELSKKEYNEIIGKIIQSKKELRSKGKSDADKDQLTEMMNRDKNSFSKEISDSKIKLKEIQNEIAKNSKINEELEQKITKNKPIFSDVEIQKKKIDEELEQRKKELEVLKKRLIEMKNIDAKNNVGEESKSVVEAASQIVATTNKRLQDTLKELEVIRQLLDKERKAHTETKKKLRN